MNRYCDLHLENTDIPANYMDLVKLGGWGNHDHPAFQLSIKEIPDGLCYECALLAFADTGEDMRDIKSAVAFLGYVEDVGDDVTGYGWEAYLDDYLEENVSAIYGKIAFDSDAETCGVYVMDSLADYRALLKAVSQAVRELAEETSGM